MAIVADQTCDALFVRETLRRGDRMIDRINSILEIAEPLLGVDRAAGQKGWIRRHIGGWLFITADPHDTIYHHTQSPLYPRPRYRWINQGDDIRMGYLTDQARAEGNFTS